MLLGFLITWTLQLMSINGFYSSFDSILRPKPVNCNGIICLKFTNYVKNKSGLIPVKQFNLDSEVGGETIIFWLVDSTFLAYHNDQIHILGPTDDPNDDPLTLKVVSSITPTIEPTHRLIILGDDTLITYYQIQESLESSLPSGSTFDLIKLFKINVNNQALIHLDSISFNSTSFNRLTKYIINSATTVEGYSYLSGIRTVDGSDQLFTIRLCSKYSLRTFVELFTSSILSIEDNYFNHPLIYSIAVEPISEIPNPRLLIAYRTSRNLYIIPTDESRFNLVRRECTFGRGSTLSSHFILSQEKYDCPILTEQKSNLCDLNLEAFPSSQERSLFAGDYWISTAPSVVLTLVYLGFPIHNHIVVRVQADGSILRCPLRTPPFFTPDWTCDLIGKVEGFTSRTFYPPFLNVSTSSIEIYSPKRQSLFSYKLISCSYFPNCLACILFGGHFHCDWHETSFESNCVPKVTNQTNGAKNIDNCLQITSISPEIIILTDPLVQFTLTFDKTSGGGLLVGHKGYEFVIYVNGDPCLQTTQVTSTNYDGFKLICTLGKRKKGVWPVTWSVGVNETNRYLNKFFTSHQSINLTIDGIPSIQLRSIQRRQNQLTIFSSFTATLIILFICSLTFKSNPKSSNEQLTIKSITEKIKSRIAISKSFISSQPSFVTSHETKTSLLSNRL